MRDVEYRPEDSNLPSYGCWKCPDCRREFYGGGKPLHDPECPHYGAKTGGMFDYPECTFVYGPKAIAEEETSDALLPYGVTRAKLREHAAWAAADGRVHEYLDVSDVCPDLSFREFLRRVKSVRVCGRPVDIVEVEP